LFEPLTDQLTQVHIASENVLRGIIILLFDKALDEPKFCGLYAQVLGLCFFPDSAPTFFFFFFDLSQICLRLSQTVPNFEQPGLDGKLAPGPTTFIRLLLRKCQDEFENRDRACRLAEGVFFLKKRKKETNSHPFIAVCRGSHAATAAARDG
jgi:translation initiation factor 4G